MIAIRLNPFSTGTTFDLPYLWVIPAQILLPLFIAFYQYRACPTIQQFAAYLWLTSLICFLGTLGNLFSGDKMAIIQQDWLVHFNAVQLAVMNLASLMATVNLLHSEEISSFADAKVAEAQLGRLKAVKVDPETQIKWEKAASHAQAQADGRSLRSTMTNLKAISLQDPSQTLTAPSSMPKEMPKRPSEPAQESGSLASLLDRIGDEPAAVAGEDLLEVNEFRPSPAPDVISAKAEAAEPEFAPLESSFEMGLESNLDRLEAAAEVAEPTTTAAKDQSSGMMGAFRSTSQTTKEQVPSDPIATATSQASPQAAAQAASQPSQLNADTAQSAPAAQSVPVDQQSANASSTRLQAMKRRNTSTFTKLQSLSSSTSLKQQPLDTTPQSEPDSLKSLLDRLDDDHVQEPAQPLTPPVELVLDTVFKEEGHLEIAPTVVEEAPAAVVAESFAVEGLAAESLAAEVAEVAKAEVSAPEHTVGHSSISDRLTAAAAPEADVPFLANLLESAEATAGGDVDNLFADLRTTESQPEIATQDFSSDLEFPKTIEVDLSPLLSEPLESAQDTEALAEPVQEVADEEEEISGSLFDGGLDSDIDNIFSELAPPEAQQEVNRHVDHVETAAPETQSEPEEEEEAERALFDGGVDSEIDDIFSNLAPAEALKEVKDVLKAPEAKATPEVKDDEDEDSDEEESLFGETLGEDLDNIFSGLTDDQQLDVSPETLAKLKQALPEGSAAQETIEEKAAPPAAAASAPAASPRATGDMPALTAEKAEEIKAEAELEAKGDSKPEAKPASPDKSSPDYKEVKEFGRLSTRSGSLKSAPEAVGTMKTIGKLLLDVKAVENIIKSGENKKLGSGLSTAKVISAARGEGIRNILVAIDTYEGVAGSLIVGHDGLVIASTVGTGWDKDMLGALSTALLSTSNLATKKLEIGKLKQMVLLTKLTNDQGDTMKTTVLTDVEVGILAVFLEQTDLTKIDGLLATIHSTIHGT